MNRIKRSLVVLSLLITCIFSAGVIQATKVQKAVEIRKVSELQNVGQQSYIVPDLVIMPVERTIVKEEVPKEQPKEENITVTIQGEIEEKVAVIQGEIINPQPVYYSLTDEEFELLCKLAFAEAGNQGSMGMVYVINCAINNAKFNHVSIAKEVNPNRYSSIQNGVISIPKLGGGYRPVTEDMITDEVREAVRMAEKKDYTMEILKEEAERLGLGEKYYKDGARYFYNPEGCSGKQNTIRNNIKVKFQHKNHIFYAYWNK